MHIDAIIDQALKARPNNIPGERGLNGQTICFDADLRCSYLAREAVRSAPADLISLSDSELRLLDARAHRRGFDTRGTDAAAEFVAKRTADELAHRALTFTAAA